MTQTMDEPAMAADVCKHQHTYLQTFLIFMPVLCLVASFLMNDLCGAGH